MQFLPTFLGDFFTSFSGLVDGQINSQQKENSNDKIEKLFCFPKSYPDTSLKRPKLYE